MSPLDLTALLIQCIIGSNSNSTPFEKRWSRLAPSQTAPNPNVLCTMLHYFIGTAEALIIDLVPAYLRRNRCHHCGHTYPSNEECYSCEKAELMWDHS